MRSTVDTTEVVVVKASAADVDLRCGGAPMAPIGAEVEGGGAVDPSHGQGTLMGKRYTDEAGEVELLCTKPGEGSLSVGDEPIHQKDAKPLPSSD
jgi:hypothetical protein